MGCTSPSQEERKLRCANMRLSPTKRAHSSQAVQMHGVHPHASSQVKQGKPQLTSDDKANPAKRSSGFGKAREMDVRIPPSRIAPRTLLVPAFAPHSSKSPSTHRHQQARLHARTLSRTRSNTTLRNTT